MNLDELVVLINHSTDSDWIKGENSLVNSKDLNLTISIIPSFYPRSTDETLAIEEWDNFFAKYLSENLIDVGVFYNNTKIYTYSWLYIDGAIIPLPIGANLLNDFYQNEYYIASMISPNQDRFNELTKERSLTFKNY